MPGKKAPDYFPLNLNMSGIGKGSYYGDVSPVLGYHHGKFDNSGLGMIMGSPINTLTNNSPNTNAFSLSEYITLNGIPPVNSEDEEEDEDDFVSHSGSESVSIQGSDDLDVDIDDVDSLVLNIRDKLQMAPNSQASAKCGVSHHWTSVGSLSNNGTSECMSPSTGNETNDLLIHHNHHRTSPPGFPNTSSSVSNTTSSSSRRRRNHPYSHVRSSLNFSQLHRKQSGGSSSSSPGNGSGGSSSSASGSINSKGHNSYYRRFHPNPPGSIGKAKSNSHHQKNWWATSVGKGCSSSSLTKQFARTDDPYQLLQELLESGSLIKEAVRRLNRKCLNSSNTQNPPQGATPNNSISANVICSNNSATGSTSSSNSRFSFIVDEDTENSYPGIPISNQ